MIRSHAVSVHHALKGLAYALTTQPNFIIHLTLSSWVILAGLYFRLSSTEWLILILTITFGLVIELVNTAIEATVDLVTQKYRPLAKIAKDTSAAAMLVFAVGSAVLAGLIFLPKLTPLSLLTP